MSKTDKDRPYWVQNNDNLIIEHDHRFGVCIIDNDRRNRWSAFRNHYRNCKKRPVVTHYCWKDDPNRFYSWRDKRYVQTCWKWEYKCKGEPEHLYHWYCDKDYYVQCIGHKRTEWNPEIPCTCDDRPTAATCFPRWNFRYTYGGVPSDYTRTYYHGPERARERKLRDFAREYNTYGELEDGDFFNRQARNSARWDYW